MISITLHEADISTARQAVNPPADFLKTSAERNREGDRVFAIRTYLIDGHIPEPLVVYSLQALFEPKKAGNKAVCKLSGVAKKVEAGMKLLDRLRYVKGFFWNFPQFCYRSFFLQRIQEKCCAAPVRWYERLDCSRDHLGLNRLLIQPCLDVVSALPSRNPNGCGDRCDAANCLDPRRPINIARRARLWRVLRHNRPYEQCARDEGHQSNDCPISVRPCVVHSFSVDVSWILAVGGAA